MKKNFDDLLKESVNAVFNGAEQQTAQTAEPMQPDAPLQEVAEEIAPAKFVKFNLEEARRSLLERVDIKEIQEEMRARWQKNADAEAHKVGRKAVGELGDYVRGTAILNRKQMEEVTMLAKRANYTKKEALEFLIEIGLTVLRRAEA